jgi:hypothetical protein
MEIALVLHWTLGQEKLGKRRNVDVIHTLYAIANVPYCQAVVVFSSSF